MVMGGADGEEEEESWSALVGSGRRLPILFRTARAGVGGACVSSIFLCGLLSMRACIEVCVCVCVCVND
jgi:hypothetical protein